jgi:hypothetical protein
MEKKLIEICAWCKLVKGEFGYFPLNSHVLKKLEDSGAIITHTMCPECSTKFKVRTEKKGGSHA